MGKSPISRRSMLGASLHIAAAAGIASPGLAALTPASQSASLVGWRKAKQDYYAADRAAKLYDRDHLMPALNAFDAFCDRHGSVVGDPAFTAARAQFDNIEAKFNDLADQETATRHALIACPAPDVAAVAFKLQLLADNEAWDCVQWDEQFGHVMADLARLGRQTDGNA